MKIFASGARSASKAFKRAQRAYAGALKKGKSRAAIKTLNSGATTLALNEIGIKDKATRRAVHAAMVFFPEDASPARKKFLGAILGSRQKADKFLLLHLGHLNKFE